MSARDRRRSRIMDLVQRHGFASIEAAAKAPMGHAGRPPPASAGAGPAEADPAVRVAGPRRRAAQRRRLLSRRSRPGFAVSERAVPWCFRL